MSLNHDANTYLAVTLASSSPFYNDPAGLVSARSFVKHVGRVGQLEDVQLFSVSKVEWDSAQEDILSFLKGGEGVVRIDVQKLRAPRSKRSDEL